MAPSSARAAALTSNAEVFCSLVMRILFIVIAVTVVLLLRWALGPDPPPPPVPAVSTMVLFWHMGGSVPGSTGSYKSGCRQYLRSVQDTLYTIVESPIHRKRSIQVRLVMPPICNGPHACRVDRWPASIQRQLFGRSNFRVERRSRLVNCTEAESSVLQQDMEATLAQIKAHCSKVPGDLVALANTAAMTGGSALAHSRSAAQSLIQGSSRSAMFEAILGSAGEKECLQRCISHRTPEAVACMPGRRRHGVQLRKSQFWWARCSELPRLLDGTLAAHGKTRGLRANVSLSPLQGARSDVTTCLAVSGSQAAP